jgi:transcriptional regulator with AAA-type ATPase domain
VEQVDLLSGLISVYNVETNEQIRLYLQDPQNNPLPSNRIANIKELKSVVEMLAEVTESVRSLAQPQPLQQQQKLQQPNKPKALPKKDEHALLAELVEEDE